MTFKTLLGAASAMAILSGVAMAQTTPPANTDTGTTTGQPSTTVPGAGTGATAPSVTGSSTMTDSSATSTTSTAASGEPVLASELMGQEIDGQDGEEIGSVSDLVVDSGSGQIQQVVITRGGVLGVGGKAIAVEFDQLQLVPNQGIRANLTAEALDAMPEFDEDATASLDDDSTQAPATGAGTGLPAAGTAAPAAPAAGTTGSSTAN